MNKAQAALEFRKAVQYFLRTLTEEAEILEIASVFPSYELNHSYKAGDRFRYGENSVGDAQLYQVLQDHTSAAEWTPDASPSLYKTIGISEDGTPEWVQPLGATDAYNTGDVVIHKGVKYISTVDGNVWEPGVYGWEVTE